MQKMFSKFAGLGLFAVAALAQAQDGGIRARVEAEMANGLHNAQEKARYDGRQPADVLEFFRLREDMRVIEMLPFGGWYTKLLGPILAEQGQAVCDAARSEPLQRHDARNAENPRHGTGFGAGLEQPGIRRRVRLGGHHRLECRTG
ncbi:MAG: hypothetical protein H6978_06375 [Gammaproteobacteria bacterium]|nr:hypothetical protein [Gammaproteobacteria bacterium]